MEFMPEDFSPVKVNDTESARSLAHSEKLQVELNMGLALPCTFRTNKNTDLSATNKAVVKTAKDDGSMVLLEIATQSDKGPLGGMDYDVLTALLSMGYEQCRLRPHQEEEGRVYYTHSEVCRRLGLSDSSRRNVKDSIVKIQSQNLKLKNFIFNASTKAVGLTNKETKIIVSSGSAQMGRSDLDFEKHSSVFYVTFDPYIMKNMQEEYFSVIEPKELFKLNCGPERRILIFINSKRKKFGNSYIFDLSELFFVLGIKASNNSRQFVNNSFSAISEKLGGFSFKITKKARVMDWEVVIMFDPDPLLLRNETIDSFYGELVNFYSTKALVDLDFIEADAVSYKSELDREYKKITGETKTQFFGEEISPGELCIDLTLYQVILCNYPVTKSLKALCKTILKSICSGAVDLPDGYRSFVTKRNKKRADEIIRNKMKEESEKKRNREKEQKRLDDKAFLTFYQDVLTNNQTYMNKITHRAISELDMSQDDPMYKISLNQMILDLAKEEFFGLKYYDSQNIKEKSFSNQVLN